MGCREFGRGCGNIMDEQSVSMDNSSIIMARAEGIVAQVIVVEGDRSSHATDALHTY